MFNVKGCCVVCGRMLPLEASDTEITPSHERRTSPPQRCPGSSRPVAFVLSDEKTVNAQSVEIEDHTNY